MKYFKKHYEGCDHEWTDYGGYEDSDITPEGEIEATVYSVDREDDKYSYAIHELLFEHEDITEITKDEYMHVVEQLQKVDELQSQINEILAGIIKK